MDLCLSKSCGLRLPIASPPATPMSRACLLPMPARFSCRAAATSARHSAATPITIDPTSWNDDLSLQLNSVADHVGRAVNLSGIASPPLFGGFGKGNNNSKAETPLGLLVFNFLENVVEKMVQPPRRRAANDAVTQLQGNFAPVPECPPVHNLHVVGKLPDCLNGGVYLRNGANPQICPKPDQGFHVFDGDGMLHAVSFQNGKATYACRFTKTNRYMQEKKAGQAMITRAFGEMEGFLGLAKLTLLVLKTIFGVVNLWDGFGSSNSGVAFFNNKLFALSEDDMPYEVRMTSDGDIETVGRHDFQGQLRSAMTGHPKVDPKTKEMFCFSYSVLLPPYLKYFWISADGVKQKDVEIKVPEAVIMHDFAVTEKYAIFPENGFRFSLMEMMRGNSPIVTDEDKVPRYGVLPRYTTDASEMKWFALPKGNAFHYYNAWDEGDEVVVCGSLMSPISQVFEKPSDVLTKPSQLRLNMKTGEVCVKQLSNFDADIGTVNPNFYGRKNRFAYLTLSGPWPKFAGTVKLDLQAPSVDESSEVEAAIVAKRHVSGCYTSEPWFVPRTSDPNAAEDDGYVLTFSHNEITNQSELLVLDARSPTLSPVATVKLPYRVPYGFHGLFVSHDQLTMQ